MSALAVLLLASQASATYLYVASYSGYVSTLNLTETESGADLETVAQASGCGSNPSWLHLKDDGTLICADEGLRTWPNGMLTTYSTNDDGSLSVLGSVGRVLVGSVSAVPYGADQSRLAVAHYAGSGITTWDISDPATITKLSQEVYKLDQPGADPQRQEAPHPHQVIVDPTGNFVLAPDLGADIVRIFSISADGSLRAVSPITVPAGSGPRHAAFAVIDDATYLYLLNELGNTLIAYKVTYSGSEVAFQEIFQGSIFGDDVQVPSGTTSAEIWVTPDQKNIVLSSRGDKSFEIPAFGSNGTVPSDTLANFAIDQSSGVPRLVQRTPAGGIQPRQLSMNADGTRVTVALQADGRVVLIERDPTTGELGDILAWEAVAGELMGVIWNEL